MVPARDHISCGSVPVERKCWSSRRAAFTLIELMVTLVIISILASLSLAGLATVRQRSKADKTRSTIRKLHEFIVPQYESYLDRRVPGANSLDRLKNIRTLMMYEMPDAWEDVGPNSISFCQTAPVSAYASFKSNLGNNVEEKNGAAECLYLIVSRSGFDPEAMEQFRGDEVGDVDGDKAMEFLDGWGRPIVFLRWAPGFLPPNSLAQTGNKNEDHDPFDPDNKDPEGYRLVPLIVSRGPDEDLGLQLTSAGWKPFQVNPGLASIVLIARDVGAAATTPTEADYFRDNITNHDLNTR